MNSSLVRKQHSHWFNRLLPLILLIPMEGTILFLAAVLPLEYLKFRDALISQMSTSLLLPSRILFPSEPIIQFIPHVYVPQNIWDIHSTQDTALLFVAFTLIFLAYLLALRVLASRVTLRYLFVSTIILSGTYMLITAITSSDILSYVAYARMAVLYHLNPLTTLPTAIRPDPIYPLLYWQDQPSIYGPVWAALTYGLQWIVLASGFKTLPQMMLALRLLGLITHLGSTWLIWSISGRMQRFYPGMSREKRLLATLAFAWNPFLLFEACVNGIIDTTLLFFVLLALWSLTEHEKAACIHRGTQQAKSLSSYSYLCAAFVLALAACIKINVLLFLPGLLLFLWWTQQHRIRAVLTSTATCLGTIVILYAPFWDSGALLNTFRGTPSSYRNIDSLADVLARTYNSVATMLGQPVAARLGFPAELVTHNVSMAFFVIGYGFLLWRAIRKPDTINTLSGLMRWLAIAWLLYCFLGSPWFWPWYAVTFFGLYALVEATNEKKSLFFGRIKLPLAVYLLSFSLLSFYCFNTYVSEHTAVPGFPVLFWYYIAGLWIWGIPLLALRKRRREHVSSSSKPDMLEYPTSVYAGNGKL